MKGFDSVTIKPGRYTCLINVKPSRYPLVSYNM